jgi:hypothetical protein
METEKETKEITISLPIIVSVKWEDDTDPDSSYYGTFSDKQEPGGIDLEERGERQNNGYRYFNPGNSGPEYIEEDYKRIKSLYKEEWHYEGCIVTVQCGKITAKSSVWGIESDSMKSDKDEIEEDVKEEVMAILEKKIMARLEVE